MDVSINWGTQKWLVYFMETPHLSMDDKNRGTPIYGNPLYQETPPNYLNVPRTLSMMFHPIS